jgi:hypothetical protein
MDASQDDFGYLREAVKKYGQLYFVSQFEEFIDGASHRQLAELASSYLEIARREDSAPLNDWIKRCQSDVRKTTSKEKRFANAAGQLLILFDKLANRNISPFNSRQVVYVPEVPRPDWSHVPERLQYLVPLAQKYGRFVSEASMLDFLQRAEPEEMEELARAAEQIRLAADYPIINRWLDQYPMYKHDEAHMVYCLLGVLDHADLDFGG